MTLSLLHDLLDRQADRHPHQRALIRSGHCWSYAQLRRRSAALAGWLAGRGVGRGDRILILDHNDMDTVALTFAASRLGAIYVIVSDRVRAYHLSHILADCSPRVVLGAGDAAERAAALTTAQVLNCADLPEDTDPPAPPGERNRSQGSAGVSTPPALQCGGLPDAQTLLATDPVALIYTSGSTALPKAVVSTHQQVLFAIGAIGRELGYRPDDVVLCCLPLSFDYGLYQTFLACSAGAAVLLGDSLDAGTMLLRRLIDGQVTVLPLVPSLAVSLCRLLGRTQQRPAGLRMVTNTGAALTPPLAARLRVLLPGLAVVAMFGLTECKRVSIAEPDLDLIRPGSVGRPLPGTEVFVLGAGGERLPAGEIGELVVRGPHVMAGYWNAPELTAARFRRDYLGRTSLHTGDYGWLDGDGYVYFAGRRDEVYKQHGYRVSTTEVEAAALNIPGVELAAAFPPDEQHRARLAVSGAITLERLAKELRTRLEEAKVPPECLVLDALPLTGNGKIDRHAVRDLWPNAQTDAWSRARPNAQTDAQTDAWSGAQPGAQTDAWSRAQPGAQPDAQTDAWSGARQVQP